MFFTPGLVSNLQKSSQLPQHAGRGLLGGAAQCRAREGMAGPLDRLDEPLGAVAVHVEPRAAEDELQVLREVERRGDEGEAEEQEEEGV